MKYLIILFSLYMTMLTLMPCQDKVDISSNLENTSTVQKPFKGIEHYEQESCPPFCTCACCSVSRHFPVVKEKVELSVNSKVPYTSYYMPAISEQPIEIYQPPKLV